MRHRQTRMAAIARVGVLAGVLAVGCAPVDEACLEPSVALEAIVSDASMDPSSLTVCRGQGVTLTLHSETDGVFHIHGYDEQVPATSLVEGEETVLEFTADTAGQFIIELHAHDGGSESEIGVLTVDEP